MEKIEAPKKERKFIKGVGRIASILAQELVLGLGKKYIGKVINKVKLPKKREMLSFLYVLLTFTLFAQYPATGNKQRLGYQTTGDGLVWRGSLSDTATIQPTNINAAWVILDTVNLKFYSFDFTSNVWNQVTSGGGSFTQPVDSLFFKTSVSPNNVDTAKMRWDSEKGTVVLGMYDQVPNELGFKNFWLVKNQTGSTITKGSLVYANGTVGASGRLTVAKFIANGTIESKLLLGITAHDLSNGEDGYVISFGKIRQVNTDTFANGAILYPSPTVAGAWTDVEPKAPNIDMPIGFCINSSSNNGTIAIRVQSGYKVHELQDVDTTGIDVNGGLIYNGSYFVASNGKLLTPSDTTSLSNRINLKLNISDTLNMLKNYALKSYADTSGRFYARQDFLAVTSSTLTWTQSDTLITGNSTVLQVYRNGQILLPTQYTVNSSTSLTISAAAYKVGENYTVIFPRGGGASSGGGSGSLTSISGGTGITVSPNPITTTGTVSADLNVLMELSDTVSLSNRINLKFNTLDTSNLNLTSRFAEKQNTLTLTTNGTSGASTLVGSTLNIPQYSGGGGGSGTVTSVATGYGLSGGTITTSGTLLLDSATVFTRIRDSIVDVAIGNDTIKILKQEYNNVSSSVLNWTVTSKFPIQLKAYILVFRNGQLLLNDQYNLTDTAQITLTSASYKAGENYTVVTVSGIGSVGSAQGNPIYPEAGIALSTGTTWTTSIPNNSTNWNTAYTDRLKWDGGSTGLTAATGRTSLGGTTIGQSMFTLTNPSAITFPRFNADNTVSALSASNFRSAIGAGTVTSVMASGTAGNPLSITDIYTTPTIELLSATSSRNGYLTSTDWSTFNNKLSTSTAASTYQTILTNPVTGTGTSGYLPKFNGTSTITNSVVQESSNNIGINTTPYASLTLGQGKNIMLDASSNNIPKILFFETDGRNENDVQFGAKIQYNSPSDRLEFVMRDSFSGDVSGDELAMFITRQTGNVTVNKTLGVTGATTLSNLAGTGNRMVIAGSGGLLSTQAIPTGTVTGVTASEPLYSTGGTAPNLRISNAAADSAGVISLGVQVLPGEKSFATHTTFLGRAIFKDYTYTATRLGGLSSTDRFATVTVGTGLSLSSGTLSATNTGTVTSVSGTAPISVANGTTTPSITIADASGSVSGVVNTTTQTFAGNKTFSGNVNISGSSTLDVGSTGTFGGRVKTTFMERTYTTTTSTSLTVGVSTTWLNIHQDLQVTLTLPNAATYPGKELHIKQTGTGSVISASSNIIAYVNAFDSSPVASILNPSTHKSVTLVSDGTYWVIMMRGTN